MSVEPRIDMLKREHVTHLRRIVAIGTLVVLTRLLAGCCPSELREPVARAAQVIGKPHTPELPDGASFDSSWAQLSWAAGANAASHDVYLRENPGDVTNGTGNTFRGNQPATEFIVGFRGYPYPDGLVPGKTNYWRIDEVNDAAPNSPCRGDVWRFTVVGN